MLGAFAVQRELRACCNTLKEQGRKWRGCRDCGAETAAGLSNTYLLLRDLPDIDLSLFSDDPELRKVVQEKLVSRLEGFVCKLEKNAADLEGIVAGVRHALNSLTNVQQCSGSTRSSAPGRAMEEISDMYAAENEVKQCVCKALTDVAASVLKGIREFAAGRPGVEKKLQVYLTAWKQEAKLDSNRIEALMLQILS